MREIKFRGKRIDNGKWEYGYLFMIWERVFILWGTTNGVPNQIEVDPKTVGQYTGRKDKNGVEIYEGDIVEFRNELTTTKYIFEVRWLEGKCGFDWVWPNHNEQAPVAFNGMGNNLLIEVIGNIYENPELLNQ